jgi:hypothetical protein
MICWHAYSLAVVSRATKQRILPVCTQYTLPVLVSVASYMFPLVVTLTSYMLSRAFCGGALCLALASCPVTMRCGRIGVWSPQLPLAAFSRGFLAFLFAFVVLRNPRDLHACFMCHIYTYACMPSNASAQLTHLASVYLYFHLYTCMCMRVCVC